MKTDYKHPRNGRYIYMTRSTGEIQSLIAICEEMGLCDYTEQGHKVHLSLYYTGLLVDLNTDMYHPWVLRRPISATQVSYFELVILLERRISNEKNL